MKPAAKRWVDAETKATQRIRAVTASRDQAAQRINDALRAHKSATALLDGDPRSAHTLAYDAARIAITAHMQAHGYAVDGAKPGAHMAVVDYAEHVLDDVLTADDMNRLDGLRRDRNQLEYGLPPMPALLQKSAAAAIAMAGRIVKAVQHDLFPPKPKTGAAR